MERKAPLYWNDKPGWSALREKNWKAHLQQQQFRLYDMTTDPSESDNVAVDHPEVAEHYLKLLQRWDTDAAAGRQTRPEVNTAGEGQG